MTIALSYSLLKPSEVESGTVAPALGELGLGEQLQAPLPLKKASRSWFNHEGHAVSDSQSDLADLPGWSYSIDEMSAGVYRIRVSDRAGRAIELTGTDIEKLIQECRDWVKRTVES